MGKIIVKKKDGTTKKYRVEVRKPERLKTSPPNRRGKMA